MFTPLQDLVTTYEMIWMLLLSASWGSYDEHVSSFVQYYKQNQEVILEFIWIN